MIGRFNHEGYYDWAALEEAVQQKVDFYPPFGGASSVVRYYVRSQYSTSKNNDEIDIRNSLCQHKDQVLMCLLQNTQKELTEYQNLVWKMEIFRYQNHSGLG